MQRLQPLQNAKWGLNIKNAKSITKTILQEHWSCSVQKTALRSTKHSKKQTISKIGHLANAIAYAKARTLAKCSVRIKKIKKPKNITKTILQDC